MKLLEIVVLLSLMLMSVKMPATYAAKKPVSQEDIFAKMEAMDRVFNEKFGKHDNEMAALNSSVKSLQDEVKSLQEEKSVLLFIGGEIL